VIGADYNTDGISDGRQSSSDIGMHYNAHHHGQGIQLHYLAQSDCHWGQEQHGCHVVQHTGHQAGDQTETVYHGPDLATRYLETKYGQVVEYASFSQYQNEQHHAEE